MTISPSPKACPPLTQKVFDEYVFLMKNHKEATNSLRAWVRETNRACRANQKLLDKD